MLPLRGLHRGVGRQQSIVGWWPPRAGIPSLGTHENLATSDQIGAALRALLTNPPQEVLDISAKGDQAVIPDLEAEAYANLEASTSQQRTSLLQMTSLSW